MDPELLNAGREMDFQLIAFRQLRCDRRTEDLQPGIENRRMNLKPRKFRIRPIRHPQVTQQISVVPP